MQIKTSDLTGVALDWAVGKAGGWHKDYPYSTDWAFGGPIIEREKIDLIYDERVPEWIAIYFHLPEGPEPEAYVGPTALIAAMRSYVDAKLGNVVKVPDELA